MDHIEPHWIIHDHIGSLGHSVSYWTTLDHIWPYWTVKDLLYPIRGYIIYLDI